MKKAIFLDRDGTLIVDVPYNADPGKVRLAPFALETLRTLKMYNYLLILITNQSGIALGYFTEKDLQAINRKIAALLSGSSVVLDDIYHCPHHPDGIVSRFKKLCNCRKPMPGLIQRAAREHDIDLSASWMIGDILDDVEAGTRAGCMTILIDNGNETEWKKNYYRIPHFVVQDLRQAAGIIEQTMNNEKLAGM